MAAINKVLHQALLMIKKNGNGRIMRAYEDSFDVDYETTNQMLADAQVLNYQGYTTVLNRQLSSMSVSI